MARYRTGGKVIIAPEGYHETDARILCKFDRYEGEEDWSAVVLKVLQGECDLETLEYEVGDKLYPYKDEKVKLENFDFKAKNKEQM